MNPIDALPDLPWTSHAKKEVAASPEKVLAMSDYAWQLGEVAVAGLIYTSMITPPWLWFAMAEGVTFGDLIDFRRLAEELPPGTKTGVETDFAVGHRFAKFYGFEDTGQVVNNYKILRRS